MAANVRPRERDGRVPLISDPLTARVADLFNVAYEILLQIFERYFAHTEETDAQLPTLADVTVALMLRVIKPLGDLITTLPAGPEHPGQTAGPSFELFYENDYLMPHREAAWALLTERLDEAAWLCDGTPGRPRRSAGRGSWPRSAPRWPGSRSPWPRTCPRAARRPGGPSRRPAGPGGAGALPWPGRPSWPRAVAAAPRGAPLAGRARSSCSAPPMPPCAAAAGAGRCRRAAPVATDACVPAGAQRAAAAGRRAACDRPAAPQPATRPAGAAARISGRRRRTPGRPGLAGAAQAATALRASLGQRPARPSSPRPTAALQRPGLRSAPRRAGGRGPRWPSCGELQRGLPARSRPTANGPYLVTNAAAAARRSGQRAPAHAPAGPVPLRRLGEQAVLRRHPRQHRVHRREGPQAGARTGGTPTPASRSPCWTTAGICQHSGLLHRPAGHRVPHRPGAVRRAERRPDGRDHPRRTGLPVRRALPSDRRPRGPRGGRLGRHPRAGHRGHQGRPVPDHRRHRADRR